MKKPKLLFLIGPTGSGKSELAIMLAKSLKGEIVSCDSMLVYKGMDIGTAKPTKTEQKGVRHHCMDLITPRQKITVYKYRKVALKVIGQIVARKQVPIIVGGSGLYVKAIIDGVASQPGKTTKIRQKLEKLEAKYGWAYLYKKLKKIDPKRASEILPNDKRRTIRALEIYEAFGKKPSEWRLQTETLEDLGYSYKIFGLQRDRAKLYDRINARVASMIAKGFVDEVKKLRKTGFSVTSRQAIGYCEILKFLDQELSLKEAVELTQKRSRHLAKKQLTWFRRDPKINWLAVSEDKKALHAVKEKILMSYGR